MSTVDDFYAFGRMQLNNGRHGRQRILSKPSVETMTTEPTPQQKAVSTLVPGSFDAHGSPVPPPVCQDSRTSAYQATTTDRLTD